MRLIFSLQKYLLSLEFCKHFVAAADCNLSDNEYKDIIDNDNAIDKAIKRLLMMSCYIYMCIFIQQ